MEYPSLVYSLASLSFLAVLYAVLRPRKWSPDEPPLIPSSLPYIGHAVGMLREGGRYFRVLR
jgi:hypothetical protein